MIRSISALRQVLLVAVAGCFLPAVHAADCFGTGIAIPPAVPQVDLLRAYRVDFSSPIRLAVDASSSVYIADAKKGEVVVRAADGRILHHQRDLGRPGAITVDEAGSVYLADLNDARVAVFDVDWRPIMQFGGGDLQQPADMALDAANQRLYISDSEAHRVFVYSTAGQRLFDFGGRGNGDGQFEYPSGIYFDALNNEVLVSDQLGFRVQVFDSDGVYQYCLGGSSANPGGFFQRGRLLSAPQGLWADAAGRIYIADSFDGQVKITDRQGRMLGQIGSFGSAPGQLRQPTDVVMDGFGRLYVASTNNARLEMYGIDAFSDPELVAPARVLSASSRLQAGDSGLFRMRFDVPGYHLSALQQDSIRLNGLIPLAIAVDDFDGDALAEVQLSVDLAALLATLPASGPGELTVQGAMPQLGIEGRQVVDVIGLPSADNDGDGIMDDVDLCTATPVGEIVDASGCALQQHCPCGEFDRLRQYMKCIKHQARAFQREGLIDHKQRKKTIKQAKRSSCAKQLKNRHKDDDDHDEDDRDEDREAQDAENHEDDDSHARKKHSRSKR